VSGLQRVVRIAAGRNLSLALRSDGTVWAWGLNNHGQLGDGTTTNRRTPVQVSGLQGAVDIAGGRDHGLAVLSNGSVWAWGDNTHGQLGDGTTTNRTSPVRAGGLSDVETVTAGAYHSLALRSDGTVWAWGQNSQGQLGDGSFTRRTTPVRVQGLTGVTAIGAGRDHSLVTTSDGSTWAWGLNDFGQLGDGSRTNRPSPVQVNGLTGATELDGGRDYSVALSISEPDITPPTQPGKPMGQSFAAGSITISWSPVIDTSSVTYWIYRDEGAVPIGTTASTTFVDSGLRPLSTHTYKVGAIDTSNNVSPLSEPSEPITVHDSPPALFTDDFSSSDFSRWAGVTRMTIDQSTGGMSPPSARAQVAGQGAFATANLGGTYPSVCMSARVNATSLGGNPVVLMRLRTPANGPVTRVYVQSSGILYVKSDVSSGQISSGVALGSGWHELELCGTVGAAGAWSLYRDGTRIVDGWTANTGTTPIGSVQIGDPAAKTLTVNFDDVRVDQTPG
jgi:hypothetical protein